MTQRKQTLREAAIDILQQSAKENQEPIHRGPERGSAPQPGSEVHDLGGSTSQNPAGNIDVGSRAAAASGVRAVPPGIPPQVPAEPRDSIEGKNDGARQDKDPRLELANPTMATATGAAPDPEGTADAHATISADGVTNDNPDIATDLNWDEKKGAEFHEELTAEEIEQAAAARREMVLAKIKSVSNEDYAALFAGSELSEEFKARAKTIFEAAVVARAVAVVEELERDLIKASEEAVTEIKEELEGQVGAYLDHMVSEWMETNQVAIETGLRTEITEEFLADLKALFEQHNINMPEDQVPVVEQMAARVDELTTQLNEALNTNVGLTKQLRESARHDAIKSVCEGLTATQAEKVKTLAEGVEFTTDSEYAEKLQIIKEQYFGNAVKAPATRSVMLTEASEDSTPVEDVEATPVVEAAAAAIARMKRG